MARGLSPRSLDFVRLMAQIIMGSFLSLKQMHAIKLLEAVGLDELALFSYACDKATHHSGRD